MSKSNEVWEACFGKWALLMRPALQMISMVPAAALEECLRELQRTEAIGPLFEPSAFIKPNAFENLRSNKELVEAVLALRRKLPDPQTIYKEVE